ncbi:MAG: tail fiber domain-containing protein [Melioribacteraceae bacterium]
MKKTLLSVLFVSIIFMSQMSVAQIQVDENGSVIIGTGTPTETGAKLNLFANNINKGIYSEINYTNPSGTNYALKSLASGGSTNYGLYTKSETGNDCRGIYTYARGNTTSYGIYCWASSIGTTNNYGIYAYAPNQTNSWAGYFNGRAYCSGGEWTPSDEKLKFDIVDLDSVSKKLKQLKPKTYKYRKIEKMSLPEENQYGLVAQDLEKIYPELVTEAKQELTDEENQKTDEENVIKETLEFKAINYDQLIPILIKGFQEQQETIEKQQAMIEDLLKRVEKLEIKQ